MANIVQLIVGGTPGCMHKPWLSVSLWAALSERVHPCLRTGGRRVVFVRIGYKAD